MSEDWKLNIIFPEGIAQSFKDSIIKAAYRSFSQNPPNSQLEAYRRLMAIAEEQGFSTHYFKPKN